MRNHLFFSYLLFILLPHYLDAEIIKVGSQRLLKTIHQGIHAAHDGDTVLVEPGIYKERNIIVDKAILLKGVKYPVLDGESIYEVLSVKRSNVIVDGFKVQHCGHSNL